jgi:hypothetical protein
LATQLSDAAVDGIDETSPSVGGCESSTEAWMIRRKKNNDKRNERHDRNGECKQRCATELAKTRINSETEECDQWKDEPAGEPFEGH